MRGEDAVKVSICQNSMTHKYTLVTYLMKLILKNPVRNFIIFYFIYAPRVIIMQTFLSVYTLKVTLKYKMLLKKCISKFYLQNIFVKLLPVYATKATINVDLIIFL